MAVGKLLRQRPGSGPACPPIAWSQSTTPSSQRRCWRTLHAALTESFPQHERLLEQHMADTLLPFATNLRIFNRVHLLTCAARWRQLMLQWGRISRWPMDPGVLTAYHLESLEMMRLALRRIDDPQLLAQEPSGASTLKHVRRARRVMRGLSRHGFSGRWLAKNMAAAYAPPISLPMARGSVA